MRTTRALLAAGALLAVLFVSGAAIGADVQVKWSQAPDMYKGLQFSSELKLPSIVADDWLCLDGLPVGDFTWWGGYYVPRVKPIPPGGYPNSDSLPNGAQGGIESFVIKIWSDIPADPSDPFSFSQPGDILATYVISNFSEVLYGATTVGRLVYQYHVELPEPFVQRQGQIYWLSIEANLFDDQKQWGWHESWQHNLDAAVQDYKGSGWATINNNLYDSDMSFEVSVVPEPGSLAALVFGAAGMATGLLRNRKRR